MREMWRSAAHALSYAPAVFCIGYSLTASDLPVRYLLRQAIRPETPVYIVNRDDIIGHYKEMLGKERRVLQTEIGTHAIEALTSNLENSYLGRVRNASETTSMGRVQTALRRTVKAGSVFESIDVVWENSGGRHLTSTAGLFRMEADQQCCRVTEVNDRGISAEIGHHGLRVFL